MKKIFSILISLFLSGTSIYAAQMETALPASIQGQLIEKGDCRGPRGHRGRRGPDGHGIRGERGHRGIPGPTGPQGPSISFEYGSATLQASSTPVQFVAGDTVPLNVPGPISSNISFDSANHLFTVHSAGTYVIDYSLEAAFEQIRNHQVPQMPVAIAININGTNEGVSQIPVGSTLPPPSQNPSFRLSSTTLQLVVNLNMNDTVKLVIVSANSNDPWFYGNGSTPNEVAFLSLRQITDPPALKLIHLPFVQKGHYMHCGPRGHRGPRGERGPQDHGHRGKRGPQGPTGPQGQPGQLAIEFGSATLYGQQQAAAVTLGLVPLDTSGPVSSNISFNPITHLFTVNSTGTYWIKYYVQPCWLNRNEFNPNQPVGIAVSINGINQGVALVPIGSSLPNFTGIRTSAGTFQIMQTLNAGDTVGLAIDSLDARDSWLYGNRVTPNLVAFLSLEQV